MFDTIRWKKKKEPAWTSSEKILELQSNNKLILRENK